MEPDKIITIVSIALTVIVFAWGLSQRVRGDSAAAVSGFIAEAEKTGLLGSEKMALVVGWLYEMIPLPFKKILNKGSLENLAQKIFDYMKKYANAYIEAKSGKGKEAYTPVNNELASEVAEKLAGLGTVGLKALAVNMNIDVTGKTDAEIIQAIALLVMMKS